MAGLIYTKAQVINLKASPDYHEKWVRDRIVEDPSLLGLGDLLLKDVERAQPKAGRLDLLFTDPLGMRRYEIELMLGAIDESHLIRTIEYWDIERKRYPQYAHTAVLVAEHVSSRFLNILTVLSQAVPVIAIQMTALQVGSYVILQFIRVFDEVHPEPAYPVEDYSERRKEPGAALSSAILEECLTILREIDPTTAFDYKRDSVTLIVSGQSTDSISFFPQEDFVGIKAMAANKQEWVGCLERIGALVMSGGPTRKRTHFRLTLEEIRAHRNLFKELFQECLRPEAPGATTGLDGL
jgi:hypothetical protein